MCCELLWTRHLLSAGDTDVNKAVLSWLNMESSERRHLNSQLRCHIGTQKEDIQAGLWGHCLWRGFLLGKVSSKLRPEDGPNTDLRPRFLHIPPLSPATQFGSPKMHHQKRTSTKEFPMNTISYRIWVS